MKAGLKIGGLGWMARCGAAALALVCAAGCSTVKPVDANTWARDFYGQPNNTLVQQISGPNVTWTITGATNIAFYAPIPTKNMIPRDTSWMDSIGNIIGDVAPWVAVGYMSGAGAAAPATIRGATTITAPAAAPVAPATP